LLEVSPSKRQVNISISNESVISGVILVLFWYCSCYTIVSLTFLAKIFMFCILFYIWNITSGIRAPLSTEKCGLNFFRVETYSGILKLQRSVVTCIYLHSRSHTCKEYKWYLSTHLLATNVTHVGTPSSGSASDNTCIQFNIDILNPSINKPIGFLITIVPPRTLGKKLSSTWVVS
jgi:hypothetical protein